MKNSVTPIFSKLLEAGISGATVVDCQGMLTTLSECDSVDGAADFRLAGGSLSIPASNNKLIMIVLKDEDILWSKRSSTALRAI